jgi:hypothetical protein
VDPDVRDCAGCERNGTTDASGGGGVVLVEDTGKRWAWPRRRERGRDGLRPGPLTTFLLSALRGSTARFLLCALPPLVSILLSVHKHAQQLHISALMPPSVESAPHTRFASRSHLLSQLLPSFLGLELDTLDAFELHKPAHDDDGDWDIALSLPAAASPLPSRSPIATPAVHHAWDAEGLSDRLRADVAIESVDMYSLGALDSAL